MVKTGADHLTFLTVKRKLKFIRFDGVIKNIALLEICHVICSFFQLFIPVIQAVTQTKTGASKNELCR